MNIIIYLLVLTLYLIVPIFLYRRPHRYVGFFCCKMCTSHNFRKFFCLNVLIAVIYSHFVFFNVFNKEYGLMLSSIILIMMFNTRWVRTFFRQMIDSKQNLMVFVCLTLLTMFIPHLFTTSITFALLVVGLSFYPEERLMEDDGEHIQSLYYKAKQSGDYKELVDEYFSSHNTGEAGGRVINIVYCGTAFIMCLANSALSLSNITQ